MYNNLKVLKIFLFVVFVMAGWIAINALMSFAHYNLYEDGKWQSAKTKLEKGVWGGWAMMLTNAGLKGGELNINAWHGYQDITLKRARPLRAVQFSYGPAGVPFSYIINETDTGNNGIMFYPNGLNRLRLFTTDAAGKFLDTHDITMPSVKHHYREHAEIKFTGDSVSVYINHIFAARFSFVSPPVFNCGFKGSSEYKELFIDNVKIFNKNAAPVLIEKFKYPFRIYSLSFGYLFLWLVVLVYCLNRKQMSAYIVYLSFLSALGVAIAFAYYYYIGCGKYSYNAKDISWHGIKSSIETDEMVSARIDSIYPLESIAGKKTVVIVMGASQTWGAGASDSKSIFTSLLQDSLRRVLSDTNITVINVAVSAISPESMYQSYVRRWALYKPALLIVNASNNDVDTAVLKTNLQAMISFNQQHKIKTLLIEGPSDGAKLPCEKDLALRTIARGNGLSSIEMLAYMGQYADSGYCWWDAVHLTDYGHFLFAGRVLPFTVAALKTPLPGQEDRIEFVTPAK